jgi:hypothetical protein
MINLKEIVEPAIEQLIHEFQVNPYVFIYECDLQARLWTLINEKIPASTRYKKGLIDHAYHNKQELTTPLHNQMSLVESRFDEKTKFWGRGHLDIGIWDEDHPDFVLKDYREKPIKIGIEFKLDHQREMNVNILYNFVYDVGKLAYVNQYYENFEGWGLWFMPNYMKSMPKSAYKAVLKTIKTNNNVTAFCITQTKVINFKEDNGHSG